MHLDVIKQWNENLTLPRRFLSRDQLVCDRLFAGNKSINEAFLKHTYPDLYK